MQKSYSGSRRTASSPAGRSAAGRSSAAGGSRAGASARPAAPKRRQAAPKRQNGIQVIRHKPEAAAKPTRGRMDISFFFLVVTLMAIGIVMVFSASYATSLHEESNSLTIFLKQVVFVAVGLVGMFFASYLPYTFYRKFCYLIYFVSLALMFVALLFPNKTGARRWIPVPGIGTFQPSELMKFALVVLFASLIAVNYRRMDKIKYGFFQFLAWLAPALLAAVLQRHLSGMLLLMIIGFGMMFIAGSKLRWFVVPTVAAGAAGFFYLSLKGFEYLKTRFDAWLDPFSNIQSGSWQICQSLYAIGSGGLMGVGLGNSTQKFLWVSEPQNDFIFSIICEELGLLGAVAIILLFVLFVCSGFSIAMRAPDRFSSMVVTGIILQFGVQALLNIAVVSNSMPTTGIALPFFSAGGTATVMQLCQMGVVLGISRYCRPSISKLPDPQKEKDSPGTAPQG